jgi:hypothetical protein
MPRRTGRRRASTRQRLPRRDPIGLSRSWFIESAAAAGWHGCASGSPTAESISKRVQREACYARFRERNIARPPNSSEIAPVADAGSISGAVAMVGGL